MYSKKEVLSDLNYRMQLRLESLNSNTLTTDNIIGVLTEYMIDLVDNDGL